MHQKKHNLFNWIEFINTVAYIISLQYKRIINNMKKTQDKLKKFKNI